MKKKIKTFCKWGVNITGILGFLWLNIGQIWALPYYVEILQTITVLSAGFATYLTTGKIDFNNSNESEG